MVDEVVKLIHIDNLSQPNDLLKTVVTDVTDELGVHKMKKFGKNKTPW